MENKLEIFKNEKFGEVRTLELNDDVWFVAKDVCDALELSNTTMAISRLDEDERTKLNLGRQGDVNLVNEYGLYNLVLASRKKEAKEFKRWITHEVIPSIRKTGGYEIPKTPMETLELMFKVQKENSDKIDKLDSRVFEIEENAPLNPGEYILVNQKVSQRIRNIKRELGLEKTTREQNSELYRAINSEIKTITGVKTRSQLRQKDLDKVLDFIRDWEPSKATRVILNQLSMDLEGENL